MGGVIILVVLLALFTADRFFGWVRDLRRIAWDEPTPAHRDPEHVLSARAELADFLGEKPAEQPAKPVATFAGGLPTLQAVARDLERPRVRALRSVPFEESAYGRQLIRQIQEHRARSLVRREGDLQQWQIELLRQRQEAERQPEGYSGWIDESLGTLLSLHSSF